jgi:hypothetical protein
MERKRSLKLVKESLTDLTSEELRSAVAGTGATDLCNPCIVSWSCDETFSLKCG